MARLVPKGSPDSRPLEVSDEAVESWTERGYVLVEGESKPAAKKAPAKRASSKSKK